MKAYIYASAQGAAANLLSPAFMDIADLYLRGFLTDTSTVWVNAESPWGGFWALTHRSEYLYLHRTHVAGYVRQTKGFLRWALSNDGTKDAPKLSLEPAKIPGVGVDAPVTLIVQHRTPHEPLKVLEGPKLVPMENGMWSNGIQTVIDLPAYTPPQEPVQAAQYQEVHANYHGPLHMMATLSWENAELIKDHLQLYEFDLPASLFGEISAHAQAIAAIAAAPGVEVFSRYLQVYSPPQDQELFDRLRQECAAAPVEYLFERFQTERGQAHQ